MLLVQHDLHPLITPNHEMPAIGKSPNKPLQLETVASPMLSPSSPNPARSRRERPALLGDLLELFRPF